MRIPLTLLTSGALASAASANTHRRATVPDEPLAFAFGEADRLDVKQATLALTTDGGELRGELKLLLSTTDPARDDRSIMLAVPRGTEIRTLAVTIDEERLTAVMATADGARRAYENTVDRMTDPALLELVNTRGDQTWLRLRVFPVTPGSPATIRIGLGVPRATQLALHPGYGIVDNVVLSVDDERLERFEVAERFVVDVPARSIEARVTPRPQFVRKGASLVAGPTVIAAAEPCPTGEVCLRMTYERVLIEKPRRVATHRMRLPTRAQQLRQIRLAP